MGISATGRTLIGEIPGNSADYRRTSLERPGRRPKAGVRVPGAVRRSTIVVQLIDCVGLTVRRTPNHTTGGGFRSAKPRWCQQGYDGVVALAASRVATCAAVRFQPTAPRFWRSCSSFRAPTMTLATLGRCKSQLSATCGTD